MAEVLDAPAGPPSRHPSISKAIKGVRRGRKGRANESGSDSVASSSNEAAEDSGSRFLSSVDGAIDKLKEKARSSGDKQDKERRLSTDSTAERKESRVSKLFHGKLGRKRNAEDDDVSRLNADASHSNRAISQQDYPSEDSLQLHKSVASSLLTEDSDTEQPPIRPSLSPRQSHAGYLTLSSPLIKAESLDAPSPQADPSQRSQSPNGNLAPRHATTLASPESRDRSPSPVGKLKEAFVPRRSTEPKGAGDTDSLKSTGSGGGLGRFLKKGAAGSRRGSRTLEEIPPLPTPPTEGAETEPDPVKSTPKLPPRLQPVTTEPPSTPPNGSDTPSTFVTPPTPTVDVRPSTAGSATPSAKASDSVAEQASRSATSLLNSSATGSLSHRRAKSATNAPSKLSKSIPLPLTPTVEESKTPGGSLTVQPNSPSGFFSSVFTATQNTFNQFTNTLNSSTAGQRSRPPTSEGLKEGEEKDTGSGEVLESAEGTEEKKPLAVHTLGSGSLSLEHLGLSESPSIAERMAAKEEIPDAKQQAQEIQGEDAVANAEDNAVAQAVSAAYADNVTNGATNGERPRSIVSLSGTQTPPRNLTNGLDDSGIKRSGSVRSRISGGRKRRHRGSSATTAQNSIATAIGASTTALVNPGSTSNGQRLTGFAVASSKRNREFHQLFRSVPEDDYLIEDYSAALQRDILLHGRLYVSEGHICFSSNILGWVTNLVISFDEVVAIEKKSTAVIFPNAIVIQTLHARNIFASFVTRDSTYDLLIGIWKLSHPNLKSSLNGVTLADGTGDKTEKAESVGTADGESLGDSDEDEVYDEDAEEEELGSFVEAGEDSIADSEAGDGGKPLSRKTSGAAMNNVVVGGAAKVIDTVETVVQGALSSVDFPGPTTHSPTACGDEATHYDKPLIDTILPAPLGKIYSLTFGPSSASFMRKWLVEDQKSLDVQIEDDKKGLDNDKKTSNFSYIKPLNASIGPKQTKCIINSSLDQFDLERAVTVSQVTQNPDVPSGNMFVTKTKYCLMWAPGNATRLVINFTIEWSGKSWLKGPIEKGTNDGQTAYAKDLVAALRAAVSTKVSAKPGTKVKGKGKRKKDASEGPGIAATDFGADGQERGPAKKAESNWGLLEPLRGPLGPIVNAASGVLNPTFIIAFLLCLIVFNWFRSSASPYGSLGVPGLATPQRIAAYEEIWRNEESELWKWLESRTSLDGMSSSKGQEVWDRRRPNEAMARKLVHERMTDRDIDEAIRVTQSKLDELKQTVERKRKSSGGEGENGDAISA